VHGELATDRVPVVDALDEGVLHPVVAVRRDLCLAARISIEGRATFVRDVLEFVVAAPGTEEHLLLFFGLQIRRKLGENLIDREIRPVIVRDAEVVRPGS
jgi:hypothetical protein